ncbi:MAG: GNAT family N-acetyltransferase [Marinicella sp.]
MALNNKHYACKSFTDLSTDCLYQILKLRNQVFVLEQQCAYQDLDNLDQSALHLYQKNDQDQILAYARILSPEQNSNQFSSIGRVVVDHHHRHEKLGRALMKKAIELSLQAFPSFPLIISAQSYLTHFYHDLGFINTGKYYLEDQIPHQEMLYKPQ